MMLANAPKTEALEQTMLRFPQVECPVVHHFGPGIYVREVTLPAGTLAIGHYQKYEHLNIMLKGAVAMPSEDGGLKIMKAPFIFTGKSGRKFGYVIEETVWQNIYATEETDIDKLEAMFLEKSLTWKEHQACLDDFQTAVHEGDRADFLDLITEAGFTPKQVRRQSEETDDMLYLPYSDIPKVSIRDSLIEGKGIFAGSPIEEGEQIGPARLAGKRTILGRYTNHTSFPNAEFRKDEDGDVYLYALKHIRGCIAGGSGDEVTVNYRKALALSGICITGGGS